MQLFDNENLMNTKNVVFQMIPTTLHFCLYSIVDSLDRQEALGEVGDMQQIKPKKL